MKSIKNIFYFVFILILAIFILLFYNVKKENKDLTNKLNEFEKTYSRAYLILNSLNYETFKAKVDKKEEFFIYLGRPNCSDCTLFDPILEEITENHKLKNNLYYLNLKDIYENESEWENFKSRYGIKHTPTLAKFKNGKVNNLVEWTEETGFTKEMINEWIKLNNLNSEYKN